MKYTAIINEKPYEVEIGTNNTVLINGEPHSIDFRGIDGEALYSLLLDNLSWEVLVERTGDQYRVLIEGEQHVVEVQDERTRKLAKAAAKTVAATGDIAIKAPMPGLVRGGDVNSGGSVEAMKMQNELRAPRAGTVKEIRVKEGDKVEQGQVLMVLK